MCTYWALVHKIGIYRLVHGGLGGASEFRGAWQFSRPQTTPTIMVARACVLLPPLDSATFFVSPYLAPLLPSFSPSVFHRILEFKLQPRGLSCWGWKHIYAPLSLTRFQVDAP